MMYLSKLASANGAILATLSISDEVLMERYERFALRAKQLPLHNANEKAAHLS
jgi:hypothetical protein